MNILAVFAHPDDETMLCGGTLALLAMQGAHVHFLCATRGEGGDTGEPSLSSREDLGKVREAEMRCAAEALGCAGLEFLDYIDPTVGEGDQLFAFSDDLQKVASQIVDSIQSHSIQAVITHGSSGEYGHPAHRLVHQAVRLAFSILGEDAPLLYTVQASFADHPKPRLMNKDDPADFIIDIHPVLERKIQAALCHRTQHALFIRRASIQAGHPLTVPEVIISIESLHRAHPPVNGRLDDELARLLLQSMSAQISAS